MSKADRPKRTGKPAKRAGARAPSERRPRKGKPGDDAIGDDDRARSAFRGEPTPERPRRNFGDNDDRPRRPAPRGDERGGRPSSDRPYRSGPRSDDRGDRPSRPSRGGSDRPSGDRPYRSGPRSDDRGDRPSRPSRPGSDRPSGDRPYRSGPRSDDRGDRPSRPSRPGSDRPSGDRPYRAGSRSEDRERPSRSSRPGSDRPSGDRPYRSGPRSDDRGDRPSRPFRPGGDRPGGDRPYRGGNDGPSRGRDGRFTSRDDSRPSRPYGGRGDDRRTPYSDRPTRPSKDERTYRPDDPLARRPYNKGERSQRFALPNPDNEGLVRLNRYLAQAGVGSRREADELITTGVVTVNGKVVTELGTKIKPDDVVHYGGQKLSMEQKRYVLMNKPKDTITTTDDPRERHTVMDLIAKACTERLYPVGRLDRNTTGVLLLTNDGDLAKKLTHPSHGAEKIYHATLDKSITVDDLHKLVEGVRLEDGPASAEEASYVGDSKREVGLKLHMGRNRVVRRMFEALGYEVVKLDRVIFAGLTKKELQRGHWRHLTDKEVTMLKRIKSVATPTTKEERGGGRLRGQHFGDE